MIICYKLTSRGTLRQLVSTTMTRLRANSMTQTNEQNTDMLNLIMSTIFDENKTRLEKFNESLVLLYVHLFTQLFSISN